MGEHDDNAELQVNVCRLDRLHSWEKVRRCSARQVLCVVPRKATTTTSQPAPQQSRLYSFGSFFAVLASISPRVLLVGMFLSFLIFLVGYVHFIVFGSSLRRNTQLLSPEEEKLYIEALRSGRW